MSDALTPRDYAKLLRPHDPSNAYPQPEADFWRKCKKEQRRDGSPIWVTPPIIRHTGVQMLATLFGVQVMGEVCWPERDTTKGKFALTCEVVVAGYKPVSELTVLALTGKPHITLSKEWPVPEMTMQIGEVNYENAGMTGRQYPQLFAYKRAFDRAVLDHLLIFNAYGDVEAPEFAQNADYEAARRQPAAPDTGSRVLVPGRDWAKLDKGIRDIARALVRDYGEPRDKVDQLYLDVAGDPETLEAALTKWLERKQAGLKQEASDLFGGQDDDRE